MLYAFNEYSLDPSRRELRRSNEPIAVEPQAFDLLLYLIENRERVVSKDDLMSAVWRGRLVSESTLSSQITGVRHAIGDDGTRQLLIRTFARKGFRFVGEVREQRKRDETFSGAVAEKAGPQDKEVGAAPTSEERLERRQITVMICKLISSGPPLSRRDPEDLLEITACYHDCLKKTVASYEGFIGKALGDEVVVYFGYPRAHEDDAERAVRAGLAAIESLTSLQSHPSATLKARVAVATGLAVVGNTNPGISNDRTAVGEPLTLAAALLTRAEPGWLVIPAATRRLIGDLFSYRGLGPAAGKSASDRTAAWRVMGESTIGSRFQALRSQHTKLIGREEEIELLQKRWKQVKSGEGRIALIYGEAGIGKSRLVHALQEKIKDESYKCLQFYCSPHRIQTALYPAISQIERAANFSHADNDAAKLRKLTRLFATPSQDTDGNAELFAELLSISMPARSSSLAMSPQRRKELILERLVGQLTALAARDPVLIVLEDAHWIDPTTRELFDIVVERVRALPVLLLITYRPEFAPPWLGQSHVSVLTLNRLDRRANAAMIRQVAKGKEFPSALMEQIVSRTDGVPLFIEEVTKSVLESGALREKEGNYILTEPLPSLEIPNTLQASLVGRLDRLVSQRAVVQASAALGREFTYSLVRAVCDLSDAELERALEQLVTSELVHQRGVIPHALYTFKHALVQDAAYGTMLKNQRIQMHARIVATFEDRFPELPVRNPDVLAYHCTEAGLYEKAIEYWIQSTRMALNRSAGVEARVQVDRAKALITKITDKAARQQLEGRTEVAFADTLIMTQGFASPDVAAALTNARDLLDESKYPVEAVHALGALCNYHLIRSEAPRGLKLVQPFLRQSRERSNVAVDLMAGTAYLHVGSFTQAKLHLENALSHYDEESCRPIAFVAGFHVRSFTLIWLALTYLYLGKLKQATETMAAAVTDARCRLHPFTLVSALLASARFYLHTRDLPRAKAATNEGFAIATEQRSPYHISRAKILRAVNVIEAGEPLAGISLMDDALLEHRKTGANFQSSFNLSCLAEAFARAGKFERALDLANAAIEDGEQSGEHWWEAEAKRIKGKILMAARPTDWASAKDCFQSAVECARRQEAKFWELRASYSLANMWVGIGRESDAQKLLMPIYAEFTDGLKLTDVNEIGQLLNRVTQGTSIYD